MIVNEVLANACKHAFPDGAKGEIAIGLSRDGDRIELTEEDSGIGLPENLAEASRKSMGMRLIETLSARLDADYRFETSAGRTGGSLFRLSFVPPARAVPDTRRYRRSFRPADITNPQNRRTQDRTSGVAGKKVAGRI